MTVTWRKESGRFFRPAPRVSASPLFSGSGVRGYRFIFRVQVSGVGGAVSRSGLNVEPPFPLVEGFGVRVQGSGFRVQGLGVGINGSPRGRNNHVLQTIKMNRRE